MAQDVPQDLEGSSNAHNLCHATSLTIEGEDPSRTGSSLLAVGDLGDPSNSSLLPDGASFRPSHFVPTVSTPVVSCFQSLSMASSFNQPRVGEDIIGDLLDLSTGTPRNAAMSCSLSTLRVDLKNLTWLGSGGSGAVYKVRQFCN